MTIDKRINFRGGGADLGAGASGAGSGRGMGPAGGSSSGGNYGGSSNRPDRDSRDRDAGVTQSAIGTLADPREKQDYIGDTIFGPTQKYSGDGIFSGYRNLDAQGQPLMGLAYAGNKIQSLFSPRNIFGGILGLINPLAGLAYRGYNYLQDKVPQTLNTFQESPTLVDFYNNMKNTNQEVPLNNTMDIREKFDRSGILSEVKPVQTLMQSPLLPGAESATGLTIAELQALINNATKNLGSN